MSHPQIRLGEADAGFSWAEHPEDRERGAFVEIHCGPEEIRVRIDRFSAVIFYYAIHGGRLYGATHLDGLCEELPADFPRRLDDEAAIQFVRTNTMIGERTLLHGVRRLPPGGVLRFDRRSGGHRIEQWWRLPGEVDGGLSQDAALDALHDGFRRAVAHASEGLGRVGLHLSGGMDSRQLLGELRAGGHPFEAFTYGMPRNLDVRVARQLAARLGFEHVVREWHDLRSFARQYERQRDLTDGMQAVIHGHGLELYELEAARVDGLLIGHFLDLFLHAHMHDERFLREGPHREEELYRLFDGGPCSVVRWDAMEGEILEPAHHGRFRASILEEIRRLDYMSIEKCYDALYLLHHGLRRLMPQCQAAAHFLPCRIPGLDPAFFDVAWSIPAALKKGRALQERLLAERYAETVDHMPLVMDNQALRHIGRDGWRQRRMRAAELARRWHLLPRHNDYYGRELPRRARRELLPWMKALLSDSPLRDAGIFRPDFYDSLFADDRFRAGVGLSACSALLSLHGFVEKYIEGDPARTAGA